MSATFAAAARRLAGAAGAVLGWTPDAFWRATPAELAAVVAAGAGNEAGGVTGGQVPPEPATIAWMREAYPDG